MVIDGQYNRQPYPKNSMTSAWTEFGFQTRLAKLIFNIGDNFHVAQFSFSSPVDPVRCDSQ